MQNENAISTAGQAQEAKQPWIAPVIEVLELNAARNTGKFTFKDSGFKS